MTTHHAHGNGNNRIVKELPEDRQTLREMLDGVNECVEGLEVAFADNPVEASQALTALLEDSVGVPNEDFAVKAMAVKPGFRIAAQLIDRKTGGAQLLELRETTRLHNQTITAIEDAARLNYQTTADMSRRPPIFLDPESEKVYWQQKAEDEPEPTFRAMKVAFACLLEMLKTIRTNLSEKLVTSQAGQSSNLPNDHEAYDIEPSGGSGFIHEPLEGTLKSLADWLDIDTRTLKDQHRRWLWLRRIHRSRWSLYLRCEKRLRAAQQRACSSRENASNDMKEHQ